ALFNYFKDKIIISDDKEIVLLNSLAGRSTCEFTIGTNGFVKNIKYAESSYDMTVGAFIIQSEDFEKGQFGFPFINKQILSLITSMPQWKPAKINGENIESTITLTVQYDLKESLPVIFFVNNKEVTQNEYFDSRTQAVSIIQSEIKRNQIYNGKKVHICSITTQELPSIAPNLQQTASEPASISSKKENEEKPEIFTMVDQAPEFIGGTDALLKYLSNNIKYPVNAMKNGIQGRVMVKFVIDPDGKVTNVEIARSANAESKKSADLVVVGYEEQNEKAIADENQQAGYAALDAEAIRVVTSMPKWIAGKQNGTAVHVQYTLPVMFRLTKN
ncbi:MAG: energy transducer TonB, partial [Paludibacter sp.]|nr:energy transducer TonB [Paludibacter sp.]